MSQKLGIGGHKGSGSEAWESWVYHPWAPACSSLGCWSRLSSWVPCKPLGSRCHPGLGCCCPGGHTPGACWDCAHLHGGQGWGSLQAGVSVGVTPSSTERTPHRPPPPLGVAGCGASLQVSEHMNEDERVTGVTGWWACEPSIAGAQVRTWSPHPKSLRPYCGLVCCGPEPWPSSLYSVTLSRCLTIQV